MPRRWWGVDEAEENQQETNKKPKQKPQELIAQMR